MYPAPSSCSARMSIGPRAATMAAGSRPNVLSVYADAVMPIAPYAPGRITHSSAHANRNAGSRPNDSRTNTYTPPERGKAAASSEYVSAPHSTNTAPTTHASRNSGTSSMRCATLAGVRKMPLPIVEPTSTATALHRPSRRINRSPQRSAGIRGTDMRFGNIHFATYDATLNDTRLGSRRLYLSAHRSRRRRTNHAIRPRLRRTLAAVQWPSVSTAQRHRHGDRVEPSVGGRTGDDTGCCTRNTRAAARGWKTKGPIRCARLADRAGATRRNHGEARVAAMDCCAASGH